jgi:hypothetical protein
MASRKSADSANLRALSRLSAVKKQNDLVRVVGVSKEMFLFQTGGGTSGRVVMLRNCRAIASLAE